MILHLTNQNRVGMTKKLLCSDPTEKPYREET